MRFIPATKIEAALASPISRRAQVNSRIAVGAFATAGAFALLAGGQAAEAKTVSSSTKAAVAPVKKATAASKYVVVKGDTLSDIAARSGVSVNALVKANSISKTKVLQVGQNLVIPKATAVASSESKPTKTEAETKVSRGKLPSDLSKDSARNKLKPTFAAAAKSTASPLTFSKQSRGKNPAGNKASCRAQVLSELVSSCPPRSNTSIAIL